MNRRSLANLLAPLSALALAAALLSAGCKKEKSAPFVPQPWGEGGNYGDYAAGADKWFLDYDDAAFDAALVVAGIPSANAAEVKAAVMDYLNSYFVAVEISFAETPLPNGSTPAPGSAALWWTVCAHNFNTMAIRGLAGNGSVTGRAIRDPSTTNENIENDSAQSIYSGDELGIFVDRYAEIFAAGTTSGIDEFARFLASLIAHEVGHSLGLGHNDSSVNIMNTSTTLNPALLPAFAPEDITHLQNALPGPGRD
jgi:hypothetical protein